MQSIKQLYLDSQYFFREIPQLGNIEPIVKRMNEGIKDIDENILKVNILTFDHLDRVNLLNTLLGFSVESLINNIQSWSFCRIKINKHINQIIINNQSTEFSTIDELLKKIENTYPDSEVVIYLKPNVEIEPIDIQLISSSKLDLNNIALYNQIHTFSNIGIVASAENIGFNEQQLGAFNLFNDAIEYFSAWALENKEKNNLKTWLKTPLSERLKVIPACRININQQLPQYLVNLMLPERIFLMRQQQLLLLEEILGAIADLLRQTEIDLTNRLLLSHFEYQNVEVHKKNTDITKQAENSLTNFQSHFKNLERECKKISKERLIGRGYYFQIVESELAGLSEESINIEEQSKSHLLSFQVDTFEHIKNSIWEHVQFECTKMNNNAIDKLNATFNREKKQIPFITENEWSDALSDMKLDLNMEQHKDHIEIKPRYRGERATRGFFKRLGEGRKTVFMILMTLSIFGSMIGFNYRDYSFMGMIFLGVFLFSFIYTFFAWKKEDKIAMEKEVEKLRDQLHTDFIRVLGEIERENNREFNEQLRHLKDMLAQKNKNMSKENADDTKEFLLSEKRLMSEKESSIKISLSKTSTQLNQAHEYIKDVDTHKNNNINENEIQFG